MKILLMSVLLLALVACGPDENGDTPDVNISGVGEKVEVHEPHQVNVNIWSASSTISITSSVKNLNVSGVNNLIQISRATIERCTMSGSDNVIQVTDAPRLLCNDSGSGNVIINPTR